jgi:hypothetical protein
MAKKKLGFRPEKFLSEPGKGRVVSTFDKGKIVFAQGEARTRSFISKGKVKLTVVSEQGKEAVIAMLGGRFLRRRMPDGAAAPHGDGNCHGRMLHHAAGEIAVVQVLQRAGLRGTAALLYADAHHADRGGSGDQLFNSSEKRLRGRS